MLSYIWPQLEKRDRADKDAHGIAEAFKNLGFEIKLHKDETTSEIILILKEGTLLLLF